MMRKSTPKVIEITEEESNDQQAEEQYEEEPATQPIIIEKVELTRTQLGLKQLSKIKGRYTRKLLKCESEEDKKKYKELIEKIDNARFILKLSSLNKNIVNKVLDYVVYPGNIDGIQEMILNEIDANEF